MNIIIFRGIWYELGMLTCGLDTLFRFVEVAADKTEVLIKKGCKVSNKDKALAGQLYNFYTKQFERLIENCFNNLNKDEVGKYIRFID